MTDDALRATERALASAPADLELRRRHARQLQRAGAPVERTRAALDLAWRLGADELWDELQAGLDGRARKVGPVELRWVPAGPFVLGSDAHDEDAAPARLVELSAFYMAPRALCCGDLRGTRLWVPWMKDRLATRYWIHDLTHARSTLQAVSVGRGLATDAFQLPSEARWERVFRARLLRRDGRSPYGVEPVGPEWTADRYAPYPAVAAKDPCAVEGELQVVRGVPLRPPHDVLYREAARPDGSFDVAERPKRKASRADRAGVVGAAQARHEGGIAARVCWSEPAA